MHQPQPVRRSTAATGPAAGPRGFTLIEVMVVIVIIGILAAILIPSINRGRRSAQIAASNMAMTGINTGMEAYRDDFGRYPPHDAAMGQYGVPVDKQAGSEILFYYLNTKFKDGESTYGPYLKDVTESRLKESGGTMVKELMTPNNQYYRYTLIYEKLPDGKKVFKRYLIVDPGPDKEFGGDVDEEQGWISIGTDNDHDGVADDADNIFSTPIELKSDSEAKK